MAVYVSPGVYTREIDLSLYIPALSTTIVGMVGVTSKGPEQDRTYISNQQQFIQVFGEPDDTIGYEAYAALQYLRRGRQLWFVRVVGPAAAAATGTFYFEDVQASENIHTGPDGILLEFSDVEADGAVFSELGDNGIVPGSVTITATLTAGPDEVLTITDDADNPGILTGEGTAGDATGTIDYATGEWTLTFTSVPKDTTDIAAVYSVYMDGITVDALTTGEWGNNVSIIIEDGTTSDTKRLSVYYDGVRVERFDSLNLDDTSDYFIEDKINDISNYIEVTVDGAVVGTEELVDVLTAQLLTGGDSDASNVVAADIVGEAWDLALLQPTGLQLFAASTAVDVNLIAAPGWSDAAVVNEMLNLCEARADCMCIIDPPTDLTPAEVVEWHNGDGTWLGSHAAFNSSYGALYYPWVKVYDAYNRQYVFTPPSGHVLAVYAYTDYNTESWYAPAGLNRGRVISGIDVAYGPTPGEMDLLYGDGNAVNPIAKFRQEGIVVWGQRTLQRAPTALDRVNVRRLMLYLRKVIATAAQYLVFEPNDEKTWKIFGNLVVPFLNDIRQRRGLYDFRVKCDETTNTPEVIDRNELHAQIFLKPVKAAEFIQIDFVLTDTGANFDEVLY